ncbi:MAG: NUDIX domain-containing protein [Flavobacteriaceae bacterium]|nr:NUDIX domain-containing protein [Bacteroidia bacterium]NND26246.1 NUDIX domain-containing protein [Flavobacteriaceae bacterium]MBT8279124.1 NUDIX domain-containing protein [Bacteroidia bacterium]NNK61066.1 NUDIX domain-containing protein [Flavobacteriaceae bacterium]NNL33299.1 NUDIX domain-containing protein [Flavobacteriaceae bacterium]
MDELIDIVTRDGLPTGKSIQKSIIHSKGHYHNTAHLWLYTKSGEILLQQRSSKKLICPLLWDVSVAGHVDAGESISDAALRETKEEIGLSLAKNDLLKIGVFECFQHYENGFIDNEFHHTFIAELKVDLTDLKPEKNEVEDLKLVTLPEFIKLLDNSDKNSHFVTTNRDYYLFVLNSIKNAIKN